MPADILLTTRKQLDIFMNPQRQRILKCMRIYAAPMTCKQLSTKLGISASSITHHIKKLEELGIVVLDHMEIIRGIQAKYYIHLPVSVNIGSDQNDDLQAERSLLSDYLFNDVWNDFKKHLKGIKRSDEPVVRGDASNGIVYLTDREAAELNEMVLDFYKKHASPKQGAAPWETAVIYFPCADDETVQPEGDSHEAQP